jgi:hypothetical protein
MRQCAIERSVNEGYALADQKHGDEASRRAALLLLAAGLALAIVLIAPTSSATSPGPGGGAGRRGRRGQASPTAPGDRDRGEDGRHVEPHGRQVHAASSPSWSRASAPANRSTWPPARSRPATRPRAARKSGREPGRTASSMEELTAAVRQSTTNSREATAGDGRLAPGERRRRRRFAGRNDGGHQRPPDPTSSR